MACQMESLYGVMGHGTAALALQEICDVTLSRSLVPLVPSTVRQSSWITTVAT